MAYDAKRNYAQDEEEQYRQAASILAGQSGSTTSGGAVNATGSGAVGTKTKAQQEREDLRNAIGTLNAQTRVPVNGEVSSYQKANTDQAFETAMQALMQGGDQTGAGALRAAWDRYRANGLVDIPLPQGGNVAAGGVNLGTYTAPATQNTPAQETVNQNTETKKTPVQSQTSGMTNKQLAAVLEAMGVMNAPALGSANASTPKNTTGVEFFAEDPMYAGGTMQTDAQFRMAYQQALAMGDRERMAAILAEWNAWKQNGGSLGTVQMQALGL